MERDLSRWAITNACPFFDCGEAEVKFNYRVLRDMAVIWQYEPPIVYGKGLLHVPPGFEDNHKVGVGVLLAIGPGYYDKKDKWIPVNDRLIPGVIVEYDMSIPWTFPEPVIDLLGNSHRLPMCPSVNIFGVYRDY